ncbi:multiple epidermal growth factor-like domains protein 10 [Crassostrea angulata]|uniref:multiple epidermal growth factor-like domains protein 10 n=1 Tax=Magallana angulata TaxID=2784310 RepID=UPI0022B19112|nr:multiple epidermal growth factor-like domains protein 10 [Crassostrea angulata]
MAGDFNFSFGGNFGKVSDQRAKCPSGTYDINCKETCSVNCNIPQSCDRTTGECIGGCQPGWKGFHCDQKCNQGTYGKDCQHRCGSCINQTHCFYVNGTCLKGCDTGYLGDKCVDENLKMESLCGKSNTIQILAISIAISIFVLLLGTILNITIWKRNQLKTRGRQSRHTTGNSDSAKPNLAESTYTELGAVNNHNAYDDLHHYSKAS